MSDMDYEIKLKTQLRRTISEKRIIEDIVGRLGGKKIKNYKLVYFI